MMINLIVACGNDGQIGKDNKLLWYIPEDFNTNDIHIAVNNINKLNGIRCYYDGTQIKLKLKELR